MEEAPRNCDWHVDGSHVSYTIMIIPQFIWFGITSSAESNFQCDYAWLIMKLYFDETSLQTMSIWSAKILLSEPSVKKCIVLACTLWTPYWPHQLWVSHEYKAWDQPWADVENILWAALGSYLPYYWSLLGGWGQHLRFWFLWLEVDTQTNVFCT